MPAPRVGVAGIDGWRDGWIIARWCAADQQLRLDSVPAFSDALEVTRRCAVVGVDMPLSLPTDGGRTSDQQLRSHLGRRSSSLFTTPCRQAVDCADWEQANETNKQVMGKGLSKQSWSLVAKIREARTAIAVADLAAGIGPSPVSQVYEVHPESSFVELCGHDDLVNKKTARGVGIRLAALEAHFGPLGPTLAEVPAGPALDDALDAIAAAWTAERIHDGTAIWFGTPGEDDQGFPLGVPV